MSQRSLRLREFQLYLAYGMGPSKRVDEIFDGLEAQEAEASIAYTLVGKSDILRLPHPLAAEYNLMGEPVRRTFMEVRSNDGLDPEQAPETLEFELPEFRDCEGSASLHGCWS